MSPPDDKRSRFLTALADADLPFARVMLTEQLAGAVLRVELVAALNRFMAEPTTANAEALILEDPIVAPIFAASRSQKEWRGRHGQDPTIARPNASLLRSEPQFSELIDAFLNDREQYARLVDALEARGYTPPTINDAISQHFENLA